MSTDVAEVPESPMGEDSPVEQENQGEQSVKAASTATDDAGNRTEISDTKALNDRMETKLHAINELLCNREALVQKAASERIHKAYSNRWQEEANELFQLAVMLRSRKRRFNTPTDRKRDRIA